MTELLFYDCECCGNQGANKKHLCSYCGTPLDIEKARKYTYKLEEKYLYGRR